MFCCKWVVERIRQKMVLMDWDAANHSNIWPLIDTLSSLLIHLWLDNSCHLRKLLVRESLCQLLLIWFFFYFIVLFSVYFKKKNVYVTVLLLLIIWYIILNDLLNIYCEDSAQFLIAINGDGIEHFSYYRSTRNFIIYFTL